jgi:hypothetical protein
MAVHLLLPAFRLLRGSTRPPEAFTSSVGTGAYTVSIAAFRYVFYIIEGHVRIKPGNPQRSRSVSFAGK